MTIMNPIFVSIYYLCNSYESCKPSYSFICYSSPALKEIICNPGNFLTDYLHQGYPFTVQIYFSTKMLFHGELIYPPQKKLLKSNVGERNQSYLAGFPSLDDYLIQNPFKCSVQEDPEQLYSYFGVS